MIPYPYPPLTSHRFPVIPSVAYAIAGDGTEEIIRHDHCVPQGLQRPLTHGRCVPTSGTIRHFFISPNGWLSPGLLLPHSLPSLPPRRRPGCSIGSFCPQIHPNRERTFPVLPATTDMLRTDCVTRTKFSFRTAYPGRLTPSLLAL